MSQNNESQVIIASNSDGVWKFTQFEKTLLDRTDLLLNELFIIRRALDRPLYHFTSETGANSIVHSQQLHMSFIRSTSDPLEYIQVMAECRDALCFGGFFDTKGTFPIKLFKHFCEESISPSVRPYFTSFTVNPESTHLPSMYERHIVELSPLVENPPPKKFQESAMILSCIYSENIRDTVLTSIRKWENEVFQPTLIEFKVHDFNQRQNEWFYILLKFCNTLAMGVKGIAFKPEEEERLILIPYRPDNKTDINSARKQRPADSKWIPPKEYLILNLAKSGLFAKIHTPKK